MSSTPPLSDEFETLAAEYALGLLEGDELARAIELDRVDPAFRDAVERWNNRMAPMLDRVDRPNRVLIGGDYGHGSLGDEASLHVVLEQLREAAPNVSAVVASGDPDRTRREHDVGAIDDHDVPALIEAAASSDLIVAGGGGLLQDHGGASAGTLPSRRNWGLSYSNALPESTSADSRGLSARIRGAIDACAPRGCT